jgi:transposase
MQGRRPEEPLRALGSTERETLEQMQRSSSERMDRVRRARALLGVADGQSFGQAAYAAGFGSERTVGYLVRRFNRTGLEALDIAPGRGRKPTYDEAARARIVATAQRTPDRRQDGSATWSLSLLQRVLRHAGLPTIGTTTIRRVLGEAGSSYQRTRTWCPTGTAVRKRKDGPVQVVDPLTEQKRGPLSGRTRMGSRRG